MGAYCREEHMALGDWELDLDYSEDLVAELIDPDTGRPRKLHIIIYDAEANLTYMGVLLRVSGDENGLTIGGRNMLWWLGTEEEGPVVVDREFISGTNKLSNPGFELDLENQGLLNWSIPGDSKWQQAIGEGRTGWGSAKVVGDPEADDVLKSTESWEARAGESYAVSIFARGGHGRGRIRIRPMLTGRFNHPNIFPNPAAGGWTNWGVAGMTIEANGDIRIGALARPQLNLNPAFDAGFNAWYIAAGSTWAWDGGNAIYTEGATPYAVVRNDHSVEAGLQGALVAPQERFLFEVHVVSLGDADGQVEMAIGWVFPDPTYGVWSTETLRGPTSNDIRNHLQMEASVPTDEDGVPAIGFVYHLIVRDQTVPGSKWTFISPTSVRVNGNLADYGSPYFEVKPGRAYQAKIPYRSTSGARGGVQVFLILKAADRVETILQGPSLPSADDVNGVAVAAAVIEWNFTVPSGYYQCQFVLRAIDVLDEWVVSLSEAELREADSTTFYLDGITPTSSADWTPVVAITTTSPFGAERVHMEIVAEEGADGWVVDEPVLIRHNMTPQTVGNVARALLLDPDTGDPLPLIAGTIGGDTDIIPSDWRIRNRTLRDCLHHLCTVVAPGYEYRVNANRTLDLDLPANLFTDHAPGTSDAVVLLPRDIDVAAVPGVEHNSEERVTDIRLVGGEREASTGMPTEIIVTAAVPGPVETDWNGNPIRRTRVVEDSTVDHYTYANSKAADLADEEANEPWNMELELRGRRTRPTVVPGDWVYAYHPEAGLEGDVAYETGADGEVVFPKRARVLGTTRKLGPSYTAWLRLLNGSLLEITGRVRWEKEDATSLTIGHRPPSYVADPQGGTAARGYERWRASRPR